jgi:hypothetical protein
VGELDALGRPGGAGGRHDEGYTLADGDPSGKPADAVLLLQAVRAQLVEQLGDLGDREGRADRQHRQPVVPQLQQPGGQPPVWVA